MNFCDECSILIRSGNGGDGVVAWRREAHYPLGGPFGGDGGDGGNIIAIGDHNIQTLLHLRYQKKIFADHGQNGQTKNCTGAKADDVYIRVPLGTQIFDQETNELIVDITGDGQKYVLAHGGKGGKGNYFFKSPINKAPTLYERGDLGQERKILLKLKVLADIGLVGLPNAGKSSIICALTNAKSKIAPYQFTTLHPVLGVLNDSKKKRSLTIADIPGLIDLASENKGLGWQFLKHIERCFLLIHVISLDVDDHEDIEQAYQIIQNQLQQFNPQLVEKKMMIVANKVDVDQNQEQWKKIQKICQKNKVPCMTISAKEKINLEDLRQQIFCLYDKYGHTETQNEQIEIIELPTKPYTDRSFTFEKDELDRWVIKSKYLSYWLHKIPLNTKDNIFRFHQKLNNCMIDQTLKQHGAKSRDIILIGDQEFQID